MIRGNVCYNHLHPNSVVILVSCLYLCLAPSPPPLYIYIYVPRLNSVRESQTSNPSLLALTPQTRPSSRTRSLLLRRARQEPRGPTLRVHGGGRVLALGGRREARRHGGAAPPAGPPAELLVRYQRRMGVASGRGG
jgi:hypothetical protein